MEGRRRKKGYRRREDRSRETDVGEEKTKDPGKKGCMRGEEISMKEMKRKRRR